MPFLRQLSDSRFFFAITHSLNGVLNLLYSLAQTLVLARVLDADTFAKAIFIVTIGFCLIPLNASVARANFILIRERVRMETVLDGIGEAAAAFHIDQLLMIVTATIVPLYVSESIAEYAAFATFGLFVNLSNMWVLEIQTMLIAADGATPFAITTLVRRVLSALTLLWLFISPDFLLFCVLLGIQAVGFHVLIILTTNRRHALFRLPRHVSASAARTHVNRIYISAQATIAESSLLNVPYMVFWFQFGVGSALIILDTGLKLVRVVLSIARILGEIVITRVSNALHDSDHVKARRLILVVSTLSLLAGLPISTALLFDGSLVFRLLLGGNNVVPVAASTPIAVMVIVCFGFQLGSHFVTHLGVSSGSRMFSTIAGASTLGFAAIVWTLDLSILGALWAFAIAFSLTSIGGIVALALMFRGLRDNTAV